MGNKNSKITGEFEVYILYKALGKDCYTGWGDRRTSHHICLLKSTKTGKFYYSELTTDNPIKKGIIKIKFGEYSFFPGVINYDVIGYTDKTIDEMEEFVKNNNYEGTIYNLFFNNCQNYAQAFIRFLNIKGSFGRAEWAQQAKTPSEIYVHNVQRELL
ncbi:unnamed protein product [Adineta ricciae]|uniref:PPPDE domain-containing protein n=1 Tax=Adineta ricciae TaxID=249248 RepID=A0A814A5R0_ADIRI|nr:unnamed protein product [Adineta ricciae]CAF0908330.1 unnamed protein product [Adineta ricciae]